MKNASGTPRRRVRRAVVSVITAVALTAGGSTAWALNRYVIDHVSISDVSAYEAAHSSATATAQSAADATTTDTTYDSDGADITISTVTTGSGDSQVTYYVADVTLTDATQLRSAFANDSFGTNITEDTSDI